jgi:glycosyltransferase involved in cell wall biosynthesis
MSLKKYGIYLAFPPMTDLRSEGLGRYLAMFLKGAESLENTRFIIVCPSWSRNSLRDLFESEKICMDAIDIVSPDGKPYALKAFEAWRKFSSRKKNFPKWHQRLATMVLQGIDALRYHLASRAVAVHGIFSLLIFLIQSVAVFSLLIPLLLIAAPIVLVALVFKLARESVHLLPSSSRKIWKQAGLKVKSFLSNPEKEDWLLRIFDEMQKVEIQRMHQLIDDQINVRAWYCPTAFWPSFNQIRAPRLMCVPDVVLKDFPTGFAKIGGNRYLKSFEAISDSISQGDRFVTYSETVKWETLIDRYQKSPDEVAVVKHAANDLSKWINVAGFPDADATSRYYCQSLLQRAMERNDSSFYTATFKNRDFKFIFYASQIRPHKNLISLLTAYEYLLRNRFLGYKLILTGNMHSSPEVNRFVIDHRLGNDVIFLHGLSVSELAACYRLAHIAVNPSLSEGGCPFTFTEALSVGTPVVMSRISVAEEVLTDPTLQAATFFDPYDWKDMAMRMEWALKNRGELLKIQQPFYKALSERSWSTVTSEHLQILEGMVESPAEPTENSA